MNDRVKETLDSIVQRFRTGDIPEVIAHSTFPIPNIPAARWSLLNRTLMVIAGTSDARGFRQWQQAGRYVKKGSKAFVILAPRLVRKKGADEEEDKTVLAGFLGIPVFRVEDTEGEPLDYQKIELPEFPLMEVAQRWGISVKAIPDNYRYTGYFSQDRREIAVASKDETIFFHELAHAGHQRIIGELQRGQDWRQEIVAELGAAALCKIVGKSSEFLGTNYRYIESYATKVNLTPRQACMRVMSDVEKVLNLILERDSASGNGNNE